MQKLYLSNDLYFLSRALAENLFLMGGSPFCKRTILVPGDRYKHFLQEYFASHQQIQVAFGLHILSLSSWLLENAPSKQEKRFPTYVELEHRLYLEVRKREIEELRGFSEEKVKALCKELSHLFHKYGTHGDISLEKWLKKEKWQQTLFQEIFHASSPWMYPTKELSLFFEQKKEIWQKESYHLFGFSAMPAKYATFFRQLPSFFYLFSPCRAFWADLLTARERAKRDIADEDNALLSHLGKSGRRLLNALEAEELFSEEYYIEPKSSHTLGMVQKALLDLENPEEIPSTHRKKTIDVFSAGHRLQEVEEVYEVIHRILEEREDLFPSDILVLLSDVEVYTPYIESLFSRSPSISYSLLDGKNISSLKSYRAIFALFSIVHRKWAQESLLELFIHPLFLKKQKWDTQDVQQIERWLSKGGVSWGFNGKQRAVYLQKEEESSACGTFSHAVDRLLFGLTSTGDNKTSLIPLEELAWGDLELFNSLVEVLEDLYRDLTPLVANEKKNMSYWIDWGLRVINRYFADVENVHDELSSYQARYVHWEEEIFTWEELKSIFCEIFSKQSETLGGANIEAVCFDHFEEGTIIDKKVIFLMGMQDGGFPRKDLESSLDEMQGESSSRGESDRFLFLEALMKTKERFFISFLHTCEKTHMDQGPSLVLDELFTFLKKSGEEIIIRRLPEKSYEGAFSPFSSLMYQKMVGARNKKQTPACFIPEWQETKPIAQEAAQEDVIVDLASLRELLRDPMMFFFKKGLHFTPSIASGSSIHKQEFILSKYDRRKLLKRALATSFDKSIEEWSLEKGMPWGPFRELSIKQLYKEYKEVEKGLERYSLEAKEIVDREFDPWEIDLGGGKKGKIYGKIEGISKLGLVELFEKNKKEEITQERWCDLLFLAGQGGFEEVPSRLLFLQAKKEEVCSTRSFCPKEEMKKLLEYYQLAQKHPSPLFPMFTKSILKEDPAGLAKLFVGNEYLPRHLEWLFQRDGIASTNSLCTSWGAYGRFLFEKLFEWI